MYFCLSDTAKPNIITSFVSLPPMTENKTEHLPEELIKPDIRCGDENILKIQPGTTFGKIYHMLKSGRDICLCGSWGFAMAFYTWFKKKVAGSYPVTDYETSRIQQAALKKLLSGFLVQVKSHQVALDKAPPNPWLRSFYPKNKSFLISFSDLLGMNGARQWYEKGIRYPVLNHRIHPFYGVYFPTRHEHLQLLDEWLTDHNHFQRAADIGCGCGVLSFLLYKHGIKTIHATDINPNAVYSFRRDLERQNLQVNGNFYTEQASLLGSFRPSQNDLVVFNPPWIPEKPQKTLDAAFYYENRFFDDYFDQMNQTCRPGTILALIFSDFSIAAGIEEKNPVEQALQSHQKHFSLLSRIQKPVTQKASRKKSWIQQVRNKETVELFIIRKD